MAISDNFDTVSARNFKLPLFMMLMTCKNLQLRIAFIYLVVLSTFQISTKSVNIGYKPNRRGISGERQFFPTEKGMTYLLFYRTGWTEQNNMDSSSVQFKCNSSYCIQSNCVRFLYNNESIISNRAKLIFREKRTNFSSSFFFQ